MILPLNKDRFKTLVDIPVTVQDCIYYPHIGNQVINGVTTTVIPAGMIFRITTMHCSVHKERIKIKFTKQMNNGFNLEVNASIEKFNGLFGGKFEKV